MKKVEIFIIVILLISNSNLVSQDIRNKSLGGLGFSFNDNSFQLNPYDFGNNPAYLSIDEQETYLRITPYLGNSWGDYHRFFDSDGDNSFGVVFRGVKNLGTSGTFVGVTSYDYLLKRNYNRSLKYETYSGESFFFVDTTAGNFRYSGPTVDISYSWSLFPDLLLGFSVKYKILDGLKSVYTNAQTTYREVGANFGAAYTNSNSFIVSANIGYNDFQELIESKDVNLLEVEVFNYRGDTYFIKDRGSSITEKIRKRRLLLGGQMFFYPGNDLSFALQGNYYPSNTQILVPQSGFIDYEEGYTSFDCFDIQNVNHYRPVKDLLLSLSLSYFDRSSWSKNSIRDLLLWDWKTKTSVLGAGVSYKIEPYNLLIASEFQLRMVSADSIKYIDNRTSNIDFNEKVFKIAVEYELLNNTFARSGFNYAAKEYDIIYGGTDVKSYLFTLGASFPINDDISLDAYWEYNLLKPGGDISNKVRAYNNGVISLRLNNF